MGRTLLERPFRRPSRLSTPAKRSRHPSPVGLPAGCREPGRPGPRPLSLLDRPVGYWATWQARARGQGRRPVDGVLAAPVKLVVWDLDDTFWQGTLSEGPVVIDPDRVDLVRTLNRRGIVNAICSKNDPARCGPSSSRSACGTSSSSPGSTGRRRVPGWPGSSRTPSSAPRTSCSSTTCPPTGPRPTLRPRSPDGRSGPHRPACSTCPSWPARTTPACPGCDQYQVLERKLADRQLDGRVERGVPPLVRHPGRDRRGHRGRGDRLYELALRTNQLNFTKRRPTGRRSRPCWPTRGGIRLRRGLRPLRRLRHLRLLRPRPVRPGRSPTSSSRAGS